MDDPISAVDANVRHQLMTNVMFDCLNKKTRILVTHAIDFLHLADRVILIKQGRIDAQGTYLEIKDHAIIKNLMKTNKKNTQSAKTLANENNEVDKLTLVKKSSTHSEEDMQDASNELMKFMKNRSKST
jgi:ABC-type proline/glycine betaine transport system ATPase subunit